MRRIPSESNVSLNDPIPTYPDLSHHLHPPLVYPVEVQIDRLKLGLLAELDLMMVLVKGLLFPCVCSRRGRVELDHEETGDTS